jgi:receptor protein-tyrosine kinase
MSSIEKAVKKAAARQSDSPTGPVSPMDAASASRRTTVETAQHAERLRDETLSRDTPGDGVTSPPPKSMARLDVQALRAAGMLTPDGAESAIAEEFRHIKRPLLNNAFGRNAALVESGNLIMVTSAMPEEGKTFVTMNLAVSLAMELDKTVLLVDADFMKESATRLFHADRDVGLLNVIADPKISLEDAIVRTDMPKLSFLPAGRHRGKATEHFASDSMKRITQELASRYSDRIVLFDSPPLLATSEAVVLASLMGQIVMVVEAGKTTHGRVKEAIARIHEDKPIGMVLNKNKTTGGSGYYYGYYGYR